MALKALPIKRVLVKSWLTKKWSRLLLSLLLFGVGNSHGQNSCEQQARTAYEQLYCQIKAGGDGAGLPSLPDFRRNSPKIQALLLRRPAARLGLEVPTVSELVPESRAVETPALQPENAKPIAPEATARGRNSDMGSCDLDGELIRCDGQQFRLVTNLPNRLLKPQALSANNRLLLSPGPGNRELKDYLLQAYQTYIEKMLTIGLGASTMSFSKFYYTHESLQRQDADFPRRMEQMFEFLKKDKATMAIQPRYHNKLPDSLDQCGRLSQDLIVCDERDLNWVYER